MKRSLPKLGLTGGGSGKAGSESDSIDLRDGACGPLRSTAGINQQASHTWARKHATTADQEPQQATPEAAPPAPQQRAATQSM